MQEAKMRGRVRQHAKSQRSADNRRAVATQLHSLVLSRDRGGVVKDHL